MYTAILANVCINSEDHTFATGRNISEQVLRRLPSRMSEAVRSVAALGLWRQHVLAAVASEANKRAPAITPPGPEAGNCGKKRTRRAVRLSGSWTWHNAGRWAVALHYMNNNFCRYHKTLRVTPAMAAGVTDRLWESVIL
jgi:hypothetical protein